MTLRSHHCKFVLDAGVTTHYRCVLCGYKRRLKPSKVALIEQVLRECPERFVFQTVSEKTLQRVLGGYNMHSNIKRPPDAEGVLARVAPCAYCDQDGHVLTRDHIIPKSHCGEAPPSANTEWVCIRCNRNKGDLFIEDWLCVLQEDNDPRYEIVLSYLSDRKISP